MKLSRAVLIDVRERSFGKRIWFRTLSSIERSLVNLTIRVVNEVKSSKLASILYFIVQRLEEALMSTFRKMAMREGFKLVRDFSEIAYSWGNVSAINWIKDNSYILFLGVCTLNSCNTFRNRL